MTWYVDNLERLNSEIEGVTLLSEHSTWLTVREWRIQDDARLTCDADIIVNGKCYEVSLRYNEAFPHTPPSVLSRNKEAWSAHQYCSGELCLEFGPDNWVSRLTGADMLESSFRLLEGEAIHNSGSIGLISPLTSREKSTIGRNLRGQITRLVCTPDFLSKISTISAPTAATLSARIEDNVVIAFPTLISSIDDNEWTDTAVPEQLKSNTVTWPGLIIPHPGATSIESLKKSKSELERFLAENSPADLPPQPKIIIFTEERGIEALFILDNNEKAISISTVSPSTEQRVHPDHIDLRRYKVGIVGCGSVGSKIAASLARSGIPSFVLVDDDILQQGNLDRNELDWRSVGSHKVDALSRHLKMIRADIETTPLRQSLGGQESGSTLHDAMAALSKCNLLIDATATGSAFNYLSAISNLHKISMVWVEVFSGGIGGLIARSRTDIDPDPQTARERILQWCADQGKPAPESSSNNYEDNSGSSPQIADDSDVSVMSAHATRLAIDTLLCRTPSHFPNSAYMVGLQEGWIFSQPFDTAPIDLGHPLPPPHETDKDKEHQGKTKLLEIIETSRAKAINPE